MVPIVAYKAGSRWYERDGHYYVAVRTRGLSTSMRCFSNGCPVHFIVRDGTPGPVNGTHNHPEQPWVPNRNKMFQVLRKRCLEEFIPLINIYQEEALRYPDAAPHLTYEYAIASMRKWRQAAQKDGSWDKSKEEKTEEEIQKHQNQEKQFEFASEIKKVLSYTNAIPFKVKCGKYVCAYCRKDSLEDPDVKTFDDPDELRIHSRTHKDIWLKRVDHLLRPQFQNEILRLDIEALHCIQCDTPIKTWNDMFQHLREHGVELDQVYTRVLPFKLRQDFMHCALCDERFLNFSFLDNHMNAHYVNYMCSECGDTFVAESRLKHHLEIHNKGRHPCPDCGKVFPLDKYMRKHQAMVHKKIKAFKCMHCEQRFHSEYERHSHVLEEHKEKVRVSTCELCGKTFDWRPYYMAHLRKVHSKEKKNKCRYCSKAFVTKHEVKMHEQRHTGSGKHVCLQCGKNFVTGMELRSHLKRHAKELGLLGRS